MLFCAGEEVSQQTCSSQTAYNVTPININYFHHHSEHVYRVIQAYDLSLHSNKDYWSRASSQSTEMGAAKRRHSVEGHSKSRLDHSKRLGDPVIDVSIDRDKWFSKKDDLKSDMKTILELSKLPTVSHHGDEVKKKVAQMLGKMKPSQGLHLSRFSVWLWRCFLYFSSVVLFFFSLSRRMLLSLSLVFWILCFRFACIPLDILCIATGSTYMFIVSFFFYMDCYELTSVYSYLLSAYRQN